ncbi:MAG: N-acetylmuramoyl-L-alanine amidase, partial [Chthoniobacteraceae bacterium]|nr:N-acetylmuramoyl-L-alanine amidase [Chthoniobacteraceae bacterium]
MRHFFSFLTAAALALTATSQAAEPLSVLAEGPDWKDLAPYQKTITRAEFIRLLDTVYAPDGAWKECIDIGKDSARIRQPGRWGSDFKLQFAASPAEAAAPPRFWRPAPARPAPPAKPLAGYTIAIDPGHLGGRWAKMEERWFQIGNAKPVMEGEMTLLTARHLAERLTALGANVTLIRKTSEPVTSERPSTLRRAATAELAREGVFEPAQGNNGPNDPQKTQSVQWQSELLFYRIAEIRERARRVNTQIRPDLVICLHCNAEEWGDPAHPQLTDKNHLHLLVNGNYH